MITIIVVIVIMPDLEEKQIAEGSLQPRPNAQRQATEAKVPGYLSAMIAPPPKEATAELLERINSRGNRVHIAMDIGLGTSAYALGSLMMFAGQGGAMTALSMWGAGTYLIALSQLRQVRGPTTEMWDGELMASALWMMASFRQFQSHRLLKWAGYSSWSGLLLCGYYGVRATYANLDAVR